MTAGTPTTAVQPYDQGWLDVGAGHAVYYEQCGDPEGQPLVYLHGGPGSGCSLNARRTGGAGYRTILLDQRGCGRSRPSVSDPDVVLRDNTTADLIADIERLRTHLGIERWLVFGGSWGVTLGLAYAEQHPDRVTGAIFVSVTMTRPEDVHWLYHGVGRFFPEQWRRFRDGVPAEERDGDLVAAYNRLLNGPTDAATKAAAAQRWVDWEDAVLSLEPGWQPRSTYQDPAYRMTFARMCAHYFSHAGFLVDGQLLRDAHRLAGIPAELIHGRLDLGGPAEVAWLVHQAWPGSRLTFVDTGHGGGSTMTSAVSAAFDRFRPPRDLAAGRQIL
jgi:proline iminopeptidase